MAKVGKGIEVINLNLAISLVLPKNCSAHLSNYWRMQHRQLNEALSSYWMNRRPTDVLSNYGLKQSPTESETIIKLRIEDNQLKSDGDGNC